jgi:hypothetical protein
MGLSERHALRLRVEMTGTIQTHRMNHPARIPQRTIFRSRSFGESAAYTAANKRTNGLMPQFPEQDAEMARARAEVRDEIACRRGDWLKKRRRFIAAAGIFARHVLLPMQAVYTSWSAP